jgi:hypothetical protein
VIERFAQEKCISRICHREEDAKFQERFRPGRGFANRSARRAGQLNGAPFVDRFAQRCECERLPTTRSTPGGNAPFIKSPNPVSMITGCVGCSF